MKESDITPGALIVDPLLGKGLVVYIDKPGYPICAFVDHYELSVCYGSELVVIGHLDSL